MLPPFSSDGGGLLLREVDNEFRIIEEFATCFDDFRSPRFVQHSVGELLAQRGFGIALGYEDLHDHDDLRHDPLMAVLTGKNSPVGADHTLAIVSNRKRAAKHLRQLTLKKTTLQKQLRDRCASTCKNPVRAYSPPASEFWQRGRRRRN